MVLRFARPSLLGVTRHTKSVDDRADILALEELTVRSTGGHAHTALFVDIDFLGIGHSAGSCWNFRTQVQWVELEKGLCAGIGEIVRHIRHWVSWFGLLASKERGICVFSPCTHDGQ